MTKRIIALTLAALLIVLAFAGCGKEKAKTEEIYGQEVAVAYNEQGLAVFDEEGHIRIYDTDEKGYIKYEEDGTPSYKYFDINGVYIHDNTLDTQLYVLSMPDGWNVTDNGFVKAKTDGKCKVMIFCASQDNNIEEFVAANRASNQDVMYQANQAENVNAVMETKDFELTANGLPAYANIYKTTDDAGAVTHYAVDIFFLMNGQIYDLNYLCLNGIGYDPDFDFIAYANDNFIIR